MRPFILILSIVFAASLPAAEQAPPVYTFHIARFYQADPAAKPEYLIVGEGAIAFHTLDDFKKFLALLPPGSTVKWQSRCTMEDPFLVTKQDIAELTGYGKTHHVKFVFLPAG